MNNLIKKIGVGIAVAAVSLSTAIPAFAASVVTYTPWTYNPGNVCPGAGATQNTNGSVTLNKPCSAPTEAAAGVGLSGVEGLSTTDLTLSFDYNGYCNAGAPRINVYLSGGSTIFLGCAYGGGPTGSNVSGTATFTAGNTYGGVLFPTGETVTGIDIVQDEQGSVTLSNIMVNGITAHNVNMPKSKYQCKKDGYKTLTDANGIAFKNQGQCVSFFNHL